MGQTLKIAFKLTLGDGLGPSASWGDTDFLITLCQHDLKLQPPPNTHVLAAVGVSQQEPRFALEKKETTQLIKQPPQPSKPSLVTTVENKVTKWLIVQPKTTRTPAFPQGELHLLEAFHQAFPHLVRYGQLPSTVARSN
jgi:hypothetical protein